MDTSTGLPAHNSYRICSALEIHAMKLEAYSFCADVSAGGVTAE